MPGGQRSPIDKALRELAQVYRSVGTGRAISLDEAIDRAGQISRRDLLRAGGVAGAAALLAACSPRGGTEGSRSTIPSASTSSSSDGPRIVIVGAGLAGLTAAYRLRQAGLSPRVFESRDRVGGRCWSARDFEGGQVGEHGGEFVDTRHVHLRILAEELGLELDDLWKAWVPGSTWLQYVDGELVKSRDVLSVMAPAIRQLVSFAGTSGVGIAPNASPAMKRFDTQTMADWWDEEVGEPRDSAAYRLWSSGQASWWGLDPDGIGGGSLIDFYATKYPGGDERYTIHNGNGQVPELIHTQLPEGAVTLEAPLLAVRKIAETFELRFENVAQPVIADRVIFTLPYNVFKNVDLTEAGFTSTRMRQIEELAMGTNAKVLMQFDEPFPMGKWSGGMQRGDEPNFGTWESGETDPGANTYGLLTVYSGGKLGASYPAPEPHGPAPRAVVDETLAAIDQVVPGTSKSFIDNAWLDFWAIDPWVGGSYAAFAPTQITEFFGVLGTPEGNAHFAGEHTSAYSQGFLNGGVESGSRATREVLVALGLPLPEGLKRSFVAQRKYEAIYPWGPARR